MQQPPRRVRRVVSFSRSVPADAIGVVEGLESRQLLSAGVVRKAAAPTLRPVAILHPIKVPKAPVRRGIVTPNFNGSATPFGKTPSAIRSAYGLGVYGSSPVTFNGIQGDGAGQTIAIIDAYDFSTAAGDLNAFSAAFGLPTLISNTNLATISNASGPTFTKVSQTGSTTALPGNDPAGPYSATGNGTWEEEAALDIEWAHVMAPRANIVLVEATTPSYANLITAAVGFARSLPGVVAVSMSFGGNEFSTETNYDATFTTPAGHSGGGATSGAPLQAGGVTFLASSGDSGIYASGTTTVTPQYPAASPNVIAVGGTTLYNNGNTYVGESTWGNDTASGTNGGGGGGISKYEAQPGYQSALAAPFSTTRRTYPDLALEADPASGVPIYDSYDFTAATPWSPGYLGGTSLACPLMAGIVAVVDQGRAIGGLGSLDGRAGTLPNLYSVAAADYHDVITGSNGYAAAAGYDLATGRGSPVGAAFVYDVGGIPAVGTVAGRTFRDTNADNAFNGTDTVLTNVAVYFDANNDGVRQASEPATTSDGNGLYSLGNVAAPATGAVRLLSTVTGFQAVGAVSAAVSVGVTTTADVGLFPTAFTDAASADAWTVRLDPADASRVQILVNNVVAYAAPKSLPASLSFAFSGANDSLAVDYTNGVPVPTGGLSLNAAALANNDTLAVIGAAGADTIVSSAGTLQFDGRTITYGNVSGVSVDPRGGTDALTVSSGTLRIPAQRAGGGLLGRTFSTLSVAAGAKLLADSAAAPADRTVYVATTGSALAIDPAGQFDLGANDLIVNGGDTAAVTALLATGSAGGAWNGPGLTSSAAAATANTNRRTALGVALNGDLGTVGFTTFDGVGVSATAVLVRYTLYGDADLDGGVSIRDFNALAGHFGQPSGATWATGDFDYDAGVSIADFNKLAANFGMTL